MTATISKANAVSSCKFSTTNWLQAINMHIDKIKNDLTDDDWRAIFDALHRLQESRTHKAQIDTGVVPGEHELLPADPPIPPPMSLTPPPA